MNNTLTKKDILKLFACITMLIDHIGCYFFPNIVFLRIIGRLSFPIFAFLIAEGFYHTTNHKKYIFRLTLLAIISQVPLLFLNSYLPLNILFTFVISLLIIIIIKLYCNKKSPMFILIGNFIILLLFMLSFLCDYYLYGILVVIFFYYFRDMNKVKYILFSFLTIIYTLIKLILYKNFTTISGYTQLFSILAILPLCLYNNKIKYTNKLKYLFYVFYPLHLSIIALIKFFANN